MKCLARTRVPASLSFKDKEKEPGLSLVVLNNQSSPRESSSAPAAPRRLRGPQNKENRRAKRCSAGLPSDDETFLGSFSSAEDSGYLSLHTSQIEHGDTDTNSAETLERSTEHNDSPATSSSRLPVLKFEEEVCQALAMSYKRTQRYDFTVINKVAENHTLHNVIGKKMGLDQVDILCGLFKKDMRHILTRILGLLGECDLISCKKVSKTWQKIICQDQKALQRCMIAEKTLRDSGTSMGSLSRDFCMRRAVFSCLQNVASCTPIHKATKTPIQTDITCDTPQRSRFAEFHEAAKSLKAHEGLRCCRLCGSPARFNSGMQRAVCVRVSCAFDFCSQCQSAYHGSTPCQRGMIRASPRSHAVPVAGSARSKRSIRRL